MRLLQQALAETEAGKVRLPEVMSYELDIPTKPLAKRKFELEVQTAIARVQSGFPK